MIAAKADVDKAILVCWTAWILSCAANTPLIEALGSPTGPVIATTGLFAAIAALAAKGIISMDVAGYILVAFLIPLSVFEIISPKAIFDGYGLPSPSPLVKSLFENFSFTKVCAAPPTSTKSTPCCHLAVTHTRVSVAARRSPWARS